MERLLSMLGAHNATVKSREILDLEMRLANVSTSGWFLTKTWFWDGVVFGVGLCLRELCLC